MAISADTVPGPIRHGILMTTAALYENRAHVDNPIPNAAFNLMARYRLWQFEG